MITQGLLLIFLQFSFKTPEKTNDKQPITTLIQQCRFARAMRCSCWMRSFHLDLRVCLFFLQRHFLLDFVCILYMTDLVATFGSANCGQKCVLWCFLTTCGCFTCGGYLIFVVIHCVSHCRRLSYIVLKLPCSLIHCQHCLHVWCVV